MFKRLIAAAAVLLALSACASQKYVVSDVTRFHTLSGPVSGQTFAIVALSPDQEQSIAYRQYGDLINARLSSLGMKQYTGSGPGGADYVVTLDYQVLGPTADVVSSGPSTFSFGLGYSNWGRPGFGYRYGIGYDPFFDTYTYTRQLFTRRLELAMYKGSTYVSGPKQRVFEGRATSLGQNSQMEPVMPYMLDAVFSDFPGQSGRTKTVTVKVPEDVELANTPSTSRPSSRSTF